MRKRSIILLLTGALLAVSVVAQDKKTDNGQKAKDRGYWSLTVRKTMVVGERSKGDETGIIGAREGLAEFRLLHHISSVFKPDGTFSVDEGGGKTTIQMGGEHTKEVHNVHRLSVSWSKPPQYVKIGEEGKIVLDVSAKFDGVPYKPELLSKDLTNGQPKTAISSMTGVRESYSIGMEVGVMPEATVGKTTFGFTMMEQVLNMSNDEDDIEKYTVRLAENEGDADAVQEALEEQLSGAKKPVDWHCSLRDVASGKLYNDEEWEQNLALGKESYMMLVVRTTFETWRVMGLSKTDQHAYTIVQYYLYKNYAEGGDVDITTRADDEDEWAKDSTDTEGGGDNDNNGENEGTLLPPWVIPVAVTTTAVVIYKVLKKRREEDEEEEGEGDTDTNKDSREDKTDPVNPEDDSQRDEEEVVPVKTDDSEDEEDKEPSTFKMILYKEFGSTLMLGDVPKIVGARIEEITAKGEKIQRPDLTAQIEIAQGSNITIVETFLTTKYQAARIRVDQLPEEEPYEGDIWFIFRAPGGALRNRLVFNIEDGRIEFFQPNLILPTGYDEVGELPFKIWGGGENPDVKVTVNTKEYTVKRRKGDENNEKEKGLWYAIITENHDKVPPKEKRKAGDYAMSQLKVEVTDKNKHVIEGTLPIMRYNMGLVFQCDNFVGCYAEPYDADKHPFKLTYKGQDVCPHMNEATYFIMTWDKKDHQLRRVVPANKDSLFYAKPLPEADDVKDNATDYLSKGTRGKTDQQIIDDIRPQFFIKEILEDGSSICNVYGYGMLDAPARRKVRLHIECVYEKVKYEAEQDVWLTSQPIRRFQTEAEEREALKLDDKITDNLNHICEFILGHDLLERIGPVYRLARIQLDGYDPRFGYDSEMVELLRDTFLRYVRGETLGANANPEGVQYLGVAAEILVALAKTNRQVESWMADHGGVWTRIGIGIATLGWSEHCVLYLRVADKMVEEINNPKPPTGPLANLRVGIFAPGEFLSTFATGFLEVGQYALTENLWQKTGELGGEFLATYRPDLAQGLANISEMTIGQVQKKLGIFGKDVRVIAKDLKNFATDKFGKQMKAQLDAVKKINANADKDAIKAISEFRKTSQWTEEEILEDAIFRAAAKDALRDIKEMERACIDLVRYRTPEAKAAFREWCYKMQSNKTAQKYLSMYKSDWANNVRSEYYRLLQEDYRIIDKEALSAACKRLREQGINVNEDDLFVFCATNSNSEALYWGDALTRDRDLSMMYNPKPTKANPHPLPQEVPQNIAEECYGEAYQKRTGMTMKEGDQAVVQKGSKEMIGCGKKDLDAAFKKEHFNEKFIDLDGVATAYEHKPAEWIIEEGARLRSLGDEAGALAKEEEGVRQALKLYFNSLEKRATYRGTVSRITPKEAELFHVMKWLEVKQQGTYSISMTDFKKILKTRYNMEITDVPKLMKDLVYRLEA